MHNDVERARVLGDAGMHTMSAPTFAFLATHTPQAFCQHLGLNWIAALDLHQQGLLSFDPKTVEQLTHVQEAELKFLGRLVAAGCCGSVLKSLLVGLRKPYAYNLERMYFDWTARHWRLLEDTEEMESRWTEWLNELIAWGDLPVLERARTMVEEALLELQTRQRTYADGARATVVMHGAGDGL